MRKSILSLALIVATSVAAGDKKQPYHINVHSGLNVFDDSQHLENGSLIGASVAFYEKETQSYALQLGVERLSGIDYEGIVLDTDIDRYYLNMIVDGEEELSITPYILLGAGYEQISRVYEAYADTKSQGFLNAGLGFKYRLNDYFNITLEARAMGKLDSRNVDYVSKLGLDFMFGGKWQQKPAVIKALDVSPNEIPVKVEKPISKVSKKEKKKRWITPEVVEEMFAKKEQKSLPEDVAASQMQAHLKALKIEMSEREARLDEKLARLERALAEKSAKQTEEKLLVKKEAQQVTMQKEQEALRLAHIKKMKETQAKIAKAEAQAREDALTQERRLEAIRIAEEKAAKEEARRVAAEIKAAEDEARREAQRELQEYKRLQALQAAQEKKAAELAKMKAAQEETDTLFVRNGMVVFAD